MVRTMGRLSCRAAASTAGTLQQAATTPFEGLSAVEDVVTSNDDYSIWLTWQSEHSRMPVPGRPAGVQASRVLQFLNAAHGKIDLIYGAWTGPG